MNPLNGKGMNKVNTNTWLSWWRRNRLGRTRKWKIWIALWRRSIWHIGSWSNSITVRVICGGWGWNRIWVREWMYLGYKWGSPQWLRRNDMVWLLVSGGRVIRHPSICLSIWICNISRWKVAIRVAVCHRTNQPIHSVGHPRFVLAQKVWVLVHQEILCIGNLTGHIWGQITGPCWWLLLPTKENWMLHIWW